VDFIILNLWFGSLIFSQFQTDEENQEEDCIPCDITPDEVAPVLEEDLEVSAALQNTNRPLHHLLNKN